MTHNNLFEMVVARALDILNHLAAQTGAGAGLTRDLQPFDDAVSIVRKWIVDYGESGLAQEAMIYWMENYPFTLSGPVAVKLAELVLLTGFKSDDSKDKVYDRNGSKPEITSNELSKMAVERLLDILDNLAVQTDVGAGITRDLLPFDDAVSSVRAWIEVLGDTDSAQEELIHWMENYPFVVSGPIAVKLAELVLITGFKSKDAEDKVFDRSESLVAVLSND